MSGSLPNLIVIGAMKCGTTSLHGYLSKHPDIFMSDPKEVNFFAGENSHQELQWYKKLFPTNYLIRGESSQNYTKAHHPFYADAPRKMYETVPDAKLIYIVRDPIERYRSHILENFYGEPPQDVKWNIENNSYVMTGMYFYQLSAYLKYFDLSQIKIVELDEIKTDRLKVMNEIFEFLGVSRVDDPRIFNFISNDHKDKEVPYRVKVSYWYRALHKLSPSLGNWLGSGSLLKKILYPGAKKIQLDTKKKNELIEELLQDINEFRKLTGMPFSGWSV